MNILTFIKNKLRFVINANVNAKADLNKDGVVKNSIGLASCGCFVIGIYKADHKDYQGLMVYSIGGSVLLGIYLCLDKNDEKKTEKIYEHEVEMAEKKHPERLDKRGCIQPLTATVDPKSVEMPAPQPVQHDFYDAFHCLHTMPELPPILGELVDSFPVKFQDAGLVHLLCMFAALCFSKVKAKYLDGELHGPYLQVFISGRSAAGKSMFRSIYEKVFSRVIQSDQEKLNKIANPEKKSKLIVQSIGAGVTSSILPEILAGNQGVIAFLFEPEVLLLVNEMSKPNSGISYELLRNAFDGARFFQSKARKGAFSGFIPAALNISVTGVENDMEKFIDFDKKAGGNANRIIWASIPPKESATPGTLNLPDEEAMEDIRNTIDEWRKQYCFTSVNGDDTAVDEYVVDLDYLNAPIEKWLNDQYDFGKDKNSSERREVNTRMAAIAFHAGIVFHMMFGEPNDDATCQKVIDLTLYVADYAMEWYIHKFAPNEQLYVSGAGSLRTEYQDETVYPKSPDDMTEEELVSKWSKTGNYEYAYLLNTKYVDKRGTSRYGGGTLHTLYPLYAERTIQNKLAEMRKARQK